jgi:alanine dehydrogenase
VLQHVKTTHKKARIGESPASMQEIMAQEHQVLVETLADAVICYSDTNYEAPSATVVTKAAKVFAQAEMIDQVK